MNLDLTAYCELRCVDNIDSDSGGRLGNSYSYAHVLEQSSGATKSGEVASCASWFPGRVTKFEFNSAAPEVRTTFSFNSGNKAWNYATLSKRQQTHELRVFILAGSEHLPDCRCLGEVSSPAFALSQVHGKAMLGKRGASQINDRGLGEKGMYCFVLHTPQPTTTTNNHTHTHITTSTINNTSSHTSSGAGPGVSWFTVAATSSGAGPTNTADG
jgi:hypothetical protein